MVRYIKDGAYTIVVNDDNLPATGADGEDENGGDLKDEKSPANRLNSNNEKVVRSKDQLDRDSDSIDYSSPAFILQNLKICVPTYEEDDSGILGGREELSAVISQQIVFYCYCLLQAYQYDEEPPIILVFGDGFIGSKVIQLLTEVGCLPLLRIFCRGEFAANNWKDHGYLADANLLHLLGKNTKPDIVLFCSEYSSYPFIYHLLSDNHLIKATTALITTTLGFQRKKLFYNFGIPTIFRTFVEPQRFLDQIKKERLSKISSSLPPMKDEEGPSVLPDIQLDKLTASFSIAGIEEENKEQLTMNDEDSLSHRSSLSSASSVSTLNGNGNQTANIQTSLKDLIDLSAFNVSERAAYYLHRRIYPSFNNLVFLFENFYSLHKIGFKDSRILTLRVMFGYVERGEAGREDPWRPSSPLAANIAFSPGTPPKMSKATKPSSRSKSRIKRQATRLHLVEKILLTMFNQVAIHFQRYFSTQLPVPDLLQLATYDELLMKETVFLQKEQGLTIGEGGEGMNNEDSTHHTSSASVVSEFVSSKKNHEYYVDAHGRHHLIKPEFLTKSKEFLRMHEYRTVFGIFEHDDNYMIHLEGGSSESAQGEAGDGLKGNIGYEFMRTLDTRDCRKLDIKEFFNQNAEKHQKLLEVLLDQQKAGSGGKERKAGREKDDDNEEEEEEVNVRSNSRRNEAISSNKFVQRMLASNSKSFSGAGAVDDQSLASVEEELNEDDT
jgi:hypothetical protein